MFYSIIVVLCDGLFYLQRNSSYCAATTTNTISTNDNPDNCFIFDWSQITNSTTCYTAYMNPMTNASYNAQMGALTVLGTIDNYNLSYQCPPNGYNGVGPSCNTPPNTQLVILYINTGDGKLYGIDVILSGSPFPPPQNLQDNQPPFGIARHMINSGITVASSGYLQICKSATSNQCSNQNINANKLPNPLPSNYGYGIFGLKSYNLISNSTWIMDDSNQLLIVTGSTFYYYFNASGFFYYDTLTNQCIWLNSCNYQCEVYNYNSRFLDYVGEWIITYKWGVGAVNYLLVDAWIGNAIDAAGIFPIIMFTDKKTGDYLGLDKLDTVGSSTMGASYWYI